MEVTGLKAGYMGKLLIADLSQKKIIHEKIDLDDARNFIGAKGLGAKLLIDRLPPKTEPLHPDNLLIFCTGPLTGTKAQTSGRGTIVTKSPLTGLFVDSHFGGIFAKEQKHAGWDFIIVKGKATKPTYLAVADEQVIFHDASDLWGLECLRTHEQLQKLKGNVKTAVIGPAGENLVKFAAITFDGHRHAGRAGTGAVMGSKNLKAITMQGTQQVPLANPERFEKTAKAVLTKIQNHDFVSIRRKYGTPFWVKPVNDWGLLPTRNFQEGYFEQGNNLNAETMQKQIVDKGGACWNCVIACWNRSSIKSGPYQGTKLIGPEYETIALMGSNCGLQSIEDVAYVNDRCNELGMDTISLGVVISFAIECYQRKILTKKDLNNIPIGWGKTKAIAQLIEAIACRKGNACDSLAEGVREASKRFGNHSEHFAMHVKGLEIPGYDPRGSYGMGLAYATSDRGACHQRAWTVTTEINNPDFNQYSLEKKASLVKNMQDDRAAFFSLVFCDFAPISEEDCVRLLNDATGFSHTVESYLLAGERIWNLIRLFNLRERLDLETDRLPPRIHSDPFSVGASKNHVITEEEFQKSLIEYYNLRGWDSKGIPTKKKLSSLNLDSYFSIIKGR